MLVFTSCINNYIPKARALASSLKKFHPEWIFCLLLGENPPQDFMLSEEPFDRILQYHDINIHECKAWIFRHRVVEICTSAKGLALNYFINIEHHDKVMYLDPDILVVNSLSQIEKDLDQYDILLTPHLLAPQKTMRAIEDNEICALKHGTYNLGFIAVANRSQGPRFSQWWSERLYNFCYDDIQNGIFTDQRWCDLAPSFFSNFHIIRDPGYNVASWNLTDRVVTRNEHGIFMANDKLLRFYHFTGYDSGAGQQMVSIYGKDMPAVDELWQMYEDELESFNIDKLSKSSWQYNYYEDGTPITDHMRIVYRDNPAIQARFSDPFVVTTDNNCFLHWYEEIYEERSRARAALKYFDFISKFFPLIRSYVKRHNGIKAAFPRLIRDVYFAILRGGFSELVYKINRYKNKFLKPESKQMHFYLNQLLNSPGEKEVSTVKLLTNLFSRNNRSLCIVDHQYGGGANSCTNKIIQQYIKEKNNVLLLTWDIDSQRINASAHYLGGITYFYLSKINELFKQDFMFFEKIMINNLVSWTYCVNGEQENNYTSALNIIDTIISLVGKNYSQLEFLYHDYYSVCPSHNLLDYSDKFCGVPSDITECVQCLEKISLQLPQDFDIKKWREHWQKLFDKASLVHFFSQSSIEIARKAFIISDNKIKLSPHEPLSQFDASYTISNDGSLVVAVIGSIDIHKGANIIAKLSRLLAADEKIVIIGELRNKNLIKKNVHIHGEYSRNDLPFILKKYNVTVAFIPSIWPETFSYVTQECMMLGLPTVAFNIGAQAERIGSWEHGLVAKEISAECAYEAIKNLDARRKKQKL